MKKEWRPVRCLPNHYEVSNYGEVRRTARAFGATVGKKLKPWLVDGRPWVSLSADCKVIKKSVHHLVLEAFVGPKPEGMYGCHKDDNPMNNRQDNLRWDTPKANSADKARRGKQTGGSSPGEKHPMCTTKEKDVRIVIDLLDSGLTPKEASQRSGVSYWVVKDIKKGKTWQHLRF